jgi:hypothetical protein
VSVPASLSSVEDAIRLAEVALGPDDLVAIVDGAAKLVMPITGPVPPEGVLRIDALLLAAVGDEEGTRLVLVTRRHTGPAIVLESELAHWRHMQREHRGRSLALCDWLVFLDDGTVLSLADLAGPPAVWS